MKVRVVTAFVPINNHPRKMEEYSALGDELRKIKAPLKAFYNTVADCWLFKEITKLPAVPGHAYGDNAAKNTMQYHIVQHQKTEWLGAASLIDTDADTFVWLDYGIMHQPGVTPDIIDEFIDKIKEGDMAWPGCWGPDVPIEDHTPHWRFCGSTLVVPRQYLRRLSNEFKDRTMRNLRLKMNVTWEVNDLARTEKFGSLPIRWYKADHNASQFKNY